MRARITTSIGIGPEVGKSVLGRFFEILGRAVSSGMAKLIEVCLKLLCLCLGRLFPRMRPTRVSRAKRQRRQTLNNFD